MTGVVVWCLITIYVGGSLLSYGLYVHGNCKRYAEWASDWQKRSDCYERSARTLLAAIERFAPGGHEVQLFQLLYNMDVENSVRTAAWAEEWRRRVPRYLRRFYLGADR